MNLKIFLVFLIMFFLLNGCTFISVLQGKPGIDVSSIKPGIDEYEAEKILGSPIRKWTTPSDTRYCIYNYDGGVPPSYENAAVITVFEAMGLVLLWEFFEATGLTNLTEQVMEDSRIYNQIALSYDSKNKAINVVNPYHDFDYLPSSNGK